MKARPVQILFAFLALVRLAAAEDAAGVAPAAIPVHPPAAGGGSVVFVHPDGSGLVAWNAIRILDRGPDGMTAWDAIPRVGLYRGHLVNSLSATSNGGGTVHAYGVKVSTKAYGRDGDAALVSASGFPGSILQEAKAAGIAIGVVQTGHLAEPGTGVFLASVNARADEQEIALQLVESGADVILGGGETLFLPKGVTGFHGKEGVREDGLDLVARARELGYVVVFTRDELLALPDGTPRVLGLLAARDTYNAAAEEVLAAQGLPHYDPAAPTSAEMTRVALRLLGHGGRQFALVVEEEGTDNFGNAMNASGWFEALRRADAAIAVTRDFLRERPDTLLLVAADSEAGAPELVSAGFAPDGTELPGDPLPATSKSGAAFDGIAGQGSPPFLAAPDRAGRRMRFGVAWAAPDDQFGGVVVRAEGHRADELPLHVDNTALFALMHAVLFPSAPAGP